MNQKYISNVDNSMKFFNSHELINQFNLNSVINIGLQHNPYFGSQSVSDVCNTPEILSEMWNEQCVINFPILYLASIYLYFFAVERGLNNFIFATRDCCHWIQIFKKLFPHTNAHYFHCSRIMFSRATNENNEYFDKYFDSIVGKNLNKTIFIDIHGTCKRIFKYCTQKYNEVPYGFLLSSINESYDKFPKISKIYYNKNKLTCLVFSARGSPCESLNYDTIGTLQNYDINGPIRDKLEYDKECVMPYHKCINFLVEKTRTFDLENNSFDLEKIKSLVVLLFEKILNNKTCVLRLTRHIGNHKKIFYKNDGQVIKNKYIDIADHSEKFKLIDTKDVRFCKIIKKTTVYGIIWKCHYNDDTCAVKIVTLKTGIYYDKKSKIYMDGNTNQRIDQSIAKEKLREIGHPFIDNDDFENHKAMELSSFNNEMNGLIHLNQYKLTPKYYGYCIINMNGVNFGLIFMQKVEATIKDILLKRKLTSKEEYIIEKTINKFHYKYGMIHNDLKPANIGVFMDSKFLIKQCVFIDCDKLKKIVQEPELVKNQILKEWKHYNDHVKTDNEQRKQNQQNQQYQQN